MTTAGLEDSPIARLILSQERAHTSTTNEAGTSTIASTVPIVILTEDAVFATQVRTALDNNANVTSAATLDEAEALANAGGCSILITDTIITRNAIESCRRRLRHHDPALAFIVAGPRDHGGMFIGLQSSGAIDGFLLKPVTAGAAQVLIESATKRRRAPEGEKLSNDATRVRRPLRETRGAVADAEVAQTIETRVAARSEPLNKITPRTPPSAASQAARPTWSLMVLALIVVAGGAWWLSSNRTSEDDTQHVIADYLRRAELAARDDRWLGARDSATAYYQTVLALDSHNLAAQRGLDSIAVYLSKQVQLHMQDKRLAQAVSALERLREFEPSYAELPLLETQLAVLRDQMIIAAPPAPVTAQPDEMPKSEERASAKPRPVQRESSAVVAASPRPATPANEARQAIAVKASSKESIAPASTTANVEPTPDLTVAPPSEIQMPTIDPPAATVASLTRPVMPPPVHTEPTAASDAPKLRKYVSPTYPSEAYARGIEGWIQVELQVTPAGNVVGAQVQDGEKRQLFSRAALAAVKQWKYEPREDATSAMPVSVRLEFRLNR